MTGHRLSAGSRGRLLRRSRLALVRAMSIAGLARVPLAVNPVRPAGAVAFGQRNRRGNLAGPTGRVPTSCWHRGRRYFLTASRGFGIRRRRQERHQRPREDIIPGRGLGGTKRRDQPQAQHQCLDPRDDHPVQGK